MNSQHRVSESKMASHRPQLFERMDDSDDGLFYTMPRLVNHIDEATIAALTQYYSEVLNAGDDVLDLMSSWVSHLPAVEFNAVAGLGMNLEELEHNPRLTEHKLHDLNADPNLPYVDTRFDAVLIAVSIQYLVRPFEVFAEIARVLRPGGQALVAMSHRCFPTKAIRAFHVFSPPQRMELVADYMRSTGVFLEPSIVDRSPTGADPLWIIHGIKGST
ncbi:MAG: methyltransferase domain-containing protein [Pseudomonadota bacterium]